MEAGRHNREKDALPIKIRQQILFHELTPAALDTYERLSGMLPETREYFIASALPFARAAFNGIRFGTEPGPHDQELLGILRERIPEGAKLQKYPLTDTPYSGVYRFSVDLPQGQALRWLAGVIAYDRRSDALATTAEIHDLVQSFEDRGESCYQYITVGRPAYRPQPGKDIQDRGNIVTVRGDEFNFQSGSEVGRGTGFLDSIIAGPAALELASRLNRKLS